MILYLYCSLFTHLFTHMTIGHLLCARHCLRSRDAAMTQTDKTLCSRELTCNSHVNYMLYDMVQKESDSLGQVLSFWEK